MNEKVDAGESRAPFAPNPVSKTLAPLILAAVMILAGVVAWLPSLGGPFLFDDGDAIINNESIRDLGDVASLVTPRMPSPTAGRPLPNITFAINYAIGGLDPFGYRVVNLLLHIAAAFALFGLLNATFRSQRLKSTFGESSTFLAFAITILWEVHPLTTSAVSYLTQRTEVMAGLFYLLTLYFFAKSGLAEIGGEKGSGRMGAKGWKRLSVAACLCAFASKEMTASLPVIVFLYDRAFVTGSLAKAWKKNGRFHLSLAACWLFQAAVMMSAGTRWGSVLTGNKVMLDPVSFLFTEFWAIATYLKLAFWPLMLTFDYGIPVIKDPLTIVACGMLVVGLFAATLWATLKRPAAGFCGAVFFAVLAPTSSFIPILDTIFEHRMYLPLAALISFLACLLYGVLRRGHTVNAGEKRRIIAVATVLAIALSSATYARNLDYSSAYGIWKDAYDKRPENKRARANLFVAIINMGVEASKGGNETDAERNFLLAARYAADGGNDSKIQLEKLALSQMRQGKHGEAAHNLEKLVELNPGDSKGLYNLGKALVLSGQPDRGFEKMKAAMTDESAPAPAVLELADLLAQAGKRADAVGYYRRVLMIAEMAGDADLATKVAERLRAVEQVR